MSYNQNSTGELKKAAVLSGDLEEIEHTVLELNSVLLASIPPKKVESFDDPYKYVPPKEPAAERGESTARESSQMRAEPSVLVAPAFRYLLGKEHVKDTEGGDAGCICKVSEYHPTVEFIRSQYCGRQQNAIMHQDVGSGGNSKQMKAYMVTTGFLVAYKNTFDVEIYNI